MRRSSFLALLVLTVLLFCTALIPQGIAQAADDGSLDATVSPQYPRPYSTVTVTAKSSSFDLTTATISITVEGKVVATGVGTDSFPVALSSPGKAVHIVMTADVSGTKYTKTFYIAPQDVSLIIEPGSTSHPFYEGSPLVSPSSPLRVVALADFRTSKGTKVAASSLIYTWSAGDQVLPAQSGIGRNALNATAPLKYRDTDISVSIQTPDQSLVGGASIPIVPVDPLVRVYKNDPLLGPSYEIALSGSVSMTDAESTFRVVPYFFPSLPTISWTVNSTMSGSDDDITVRSTGSGAGTAALGVQASHAATLDSASQNFTVSFGASKQLGIFGL